MLRARFNYDELSVFPFTSSHFEFPARQPAPKLIKGWSGNELRVRHFTSIRTKTASVYAIINIFL